MREINKKMRAEWYAERISAEEIKYDLDHALELLSNLVSVEPEEISNPRAYVNNLHTLTRAIHTGNVDGEIPDNRSENEIVSLLKKAESQIIWEGEYFSEVRWKRIQIWNKLRV